jgi:folate-binding protein YgfZ
VRTDIGVDLICDASDTERLIEALRARGASPVSERAAECVRVEHGRPRYGLDLDDTVIPQEAGLNERAVSFTKGCYVGQETVARLFYKGKPNRHLRGLRLSSPAEHGDQLLLGDRVLGSIGSCVDSPRLGPIALALVRREAEPGAVVSVGEHGVEAEVVELPFSGGS